MIKCISRNIDAANANLGHELYEVAHHETLGAADIENFGVGLEVIMIAKSPDRLLPEARVIIVAAIARETVAVEIALIELSRDRAVLFHDLSAARIDRPPRLRI